MSLEDLGWNPGFAREFAPYHKEGWQPARLIRDNKITYGARFADGQELEVIMSGKVYHEAETDAQLPAVGDWVAIDLTGREQGFPVIRARLPRQTCLSRKMAGKSTEEQVIAANVDIVVVVTDPGPDFSLRRLERYFAIIGLSRAKPVVLVNKSDLFPAAECRKAAEAIQALNPEADVHITSAAKPSSLRVLKEYLKPGVSMTLIGSSGVGKSSVVNHIVGDDYQWTDEVNEVTGKGRHSTTARELIVLENGGILIDNPGIREVFVWTDEVTLRDRFRDIDELATQCRFHDCKHGPDAGCAIRAAIAAGTLSQARFESYLKLDTEIAILRKNRKKREMTVVRRAKRDKHGAARRLDELEELEPEHIPRGR